MGCVTRFAPHTALQSVAACKLKGRTPPYGRSTPISEAGLGTTVHAPKTRHKCTYKTYTSNVESVPGTNINNAWFSWYKITSPDEISKAGLGACAETPGAHNRATMAPIRQSRPDSGLGVRLKKIKPFKLSPFRSLAA